MKERPVIADLWRSWKNPEGGHHAHRLGYVTPDNEYWLKDSRNEDRETNRLRATGQAA